MVQVPALVWQQSLFAGGPDPGVDTSFSGLVRHQLDTEAWVDHVTGWLAGADELFAWLVEHAAWAEHDRPMYGRMVAQPRLTAHWDASPETAAGDGIPAPLDAIRMALTERYGRPFDSVGANLYRDGHDSVAWHGDRIARTVDRPLVATVSLGCRRRFLVRPKGGGSSHRFEPGPGDLLVMGGTCQRTWQHCVPKVAAAGPRISVTVRHSR
jgi:alkylated DNA repair dioxygenase AlkB